MTGFFKHHLDKVEKEELHTQIKDFQNEIIPLIAVMSTIEFLAKKYHTLSLRAEIFKSLP